MYDILSTSPAIHRKADRCDLSISSTTFHCVLCLRKGRGSFAKTPRTARTYKGRVGKRQPAKEAKQWMYDTASPGSEDQGMPSFVLLLAVERSVEGANLYRETYRPHTSRFE